MFIFDNPIPGEILVKIAGKIVLGGVLILALLSGKAMSGGSSFPKILSDIKVDHEIGDSVKPVNSYRGIIDRNIFKISGEEIKAAPAPTQLKLRLVGSHISAYETFAIIEDTKNRNQEIFDIGNNVFGQATLESIETEKVIIERNGERESLFIDDGASTLDGTAVFNKSDANENEAESISVTIDRSEVDNGLADMPALLSHARAVPYFRAGKSIGVRIFAIRKNSVYEKLGLKNGDIIKTVNGTNLGSIADVGKLLNKLREEDEIIVHMERKGRNITYEFGID